MSIPLTDAVTGAEGSPPPASIPWSQSQFVDLVQGLDAIVWEMDVRTLRFTFVSDRAEHLLGYPVRRWIEEPRFWQDVLLHPDDRVWALDFCDCAVQEVRDHEFEYRAVRADGRVVWMRDLVRVVVDGDGQPQRLRGVMIEISEKKEAEEALRAAEGHAQQLAARMRAVAGAAAGVVGAASIETLLPVLHDALGKVISFDVFLLSLYDEDSRTLTYYGYDSGLPVSREVVPVDRTPAGEVIASRRPTVTRFRDRNAPPPLTFGTGRPAESIIRTPVVEGDRVLGVLSVQSYTRELYVEQDLEVLEVIASLASTALLNIELLCERDQAEQALRRAKEELEVRVVERTAELAEINKALETEIAERKAATAELKKRTDELEAIFRALPDLYFRLSTDGYILDFRTSGDDPRYLTPERFVGRTLPDMLQELATADVNARVLDALEEVNRTGRLVSFEYPLLVDGLGRDFEARLLRLDDGSLFAVVRDITERKQFENALQEREEHFRKLIETAHDLIQTLDARGRIVYTGPSVERLLGYTPEELAGIGLPTFIHPDDQARVQAKILRAMANPGEIIQTEYRVRHKDGRWRWFETLARTFSPDTAEHGLVANARDITERRQAEEALARAKEDAERAREAAERANRAKSEFLSRMSHELRTPMNSILGFAQLLDRARLPAEQKKSVGHILGAGRHLLQLINEVLEISRIEAGRSSLSLEPVRLGTVLREAVGLVRPLAAQWRVELDAGPWPTCSTFVQADRQRLTQVLLNLFGNAIKYNRPGGRVDFICETCEAEDGQQHLVVRVSDTGRGIPEERIDQLFTPFARLGAEQSEVEGTGLGLALSQRLTEAMGGTLTLESTGPHGSVFRLDLLVAADPAERLEEHAGTSEPLEEVPHAPATLLYIEDNLANLSLVETILLSRPRWRTMPALQGRIGLELAREHLPDIILLDLHLPDLSGEEVLRLLRAESRTASIPVVIITADATDRATERLRLAGADAYLTKPLDIDEFLETLGRFLPAPA